MSTPSINEWILRSIVYTEDANDCIPTGEVSENFTLFTACEVTNRKLSRLIRHFFPKLTTSTIRHAGERIVVYNDIRWRTYADPVLTHNLHQLQENKFIFVHPTHTRNDSLVTFEIDTEAQLQITLFGTVLDLNAIGLNDFSSLPIVECTLQCVRLCYGVRCFSKAVGGEIWKNGEESFKATAAPTCKRLIYSRNAEMCSPCFQLKKDAETKEKEEIDQQILANLRSLIFSLLPGQIPNIGTILETIVKNKNARVYPRNRRWEVSTLQACCKWYYRDSNSYRIWQEIVTLPSHKTLQRLRNTLHKEAGLNEERVMLKEEEAEQQMVDADEENDEIMYNQAANQGDLICGSYQNTDPNLSGTLDMHRLTNSPNLQQTGVELSSMDQGFEVKTEDHPDTYNTAMENIQSTMKEEKEGVELSSMDLGFEVKTEDYSDTYNTAMENIQSAMKEEQEASSMKTEGMDYDQVTRMMEFSPSVKEDPEKTNLRIESYCSLTRNDTLAQTCRMQKVKTEKVDFDIQNNAAALFILPQTGLCKSDIAQGRDNSTDDLESQHVADKCFVVKAETGEICCEIDMSSKKSMIKTEHLPVGETENKPQRKHVFKCGECEYSNTKQYNLTKHMKTHTGKKRSKCSECSYSANKSIIWLYTREKPFMCDECDYSCYSRRSLIEHKRVHTGEKPYKCDECDYSCSANRNLIRHKKIHTGEKPFKCDECDHSCSQSSSLIEHKRVHTGEKSFRCKECDFSCSQSSSLSRHKRVHTAEKPFKCDECEYSASLMYYLTRHKKIHTGDKVFKCDECDYSCYLRCDLTRHKRIHTGDKPFKCKECDYSSSGQNNLNVYKRVHTGEKPFKCRECSYSANEKYNLVIHKRVHTGDKPFKCDECDYSSSEKGSLNVHKRIHTGEKPFRCKECDYSSSAIRNLTRHKKIHTGEKPFKCKECDYSCFRRDALIVHKRVHTGERPFKCDECDYSFSRKGGLNVHKRVHTGEKPFKCDECDYSCSRKDGLNVHKRVHTWRETIYV